MGERFDYIIVGAGSAGCLLANRLSKDPKNRVLLLEAGGKDDWIWFHIPVGYLFAIGNPRADWMFSTDGVPGLNGRELAYPRGKVIGGSSAINAMIYMRGQAADYEGWRQLGLTGWGWDDVRLHFLRHEDHVSGGDHHGQGGEWRVEHPRMRWKVLDAFADARRMARRSRTCSRCRASRSSTRMVARGPSCTSRTSRTSRAGRRAPSSRGR